MFSLFRISSASKGADMMRVILGVLLSLAFLPSLQGQQWDELVLLPLNVSPTVGAFESLWASQIWAFNACPGEAQIHPSAPEFSLPQGHAVQLPVPRTAPDRPGLFLITYSDAPECLTFHHRIANVARSQYSAGTSIPVVREQELVNGTIALLAVPLGNHLYRVHLRIYSLECGSVVVRLEDGMSKEHHEERVDLQCGAFPWEPSYAGMNLDQFAERSRLNGSELHVLVRPVSGERIWSFASVTNNQTQEVTVIAPQ